MAAVWRFDNSAESTWYSRRRRNLKMHVAPSTAGLSKPGIFAELRQQLTGLLADERDALANCANVAALIYQALPDLNWAGFYFLRQAELVLGPFQGNVACVRIPLGRGVCGTAAQRRETLIVPDVEAFPGHIACDAASRSEIVVPLIQSGRLLGVLDIDSPLPNRFEREDAAGLDSLMRLLIEGSDFSRLATCPS
jgi:L-methionine (R)-S-oxide reductase